MTVLAAALENSDITGPEFKANPFPLFAQLRVERPVCRATLPDKAPIWLVTRHEDVHISRQNNRHIGFGYGEHFCLGAPLARLEAQIAISTLLQRAPDLHMNASSESLRWRRSLILRGLEALPVAF